MQSIYQSFFIKEVQQIPFGLLVSLNGCVSHDTIAVRFLRSRFDSKSILNSKTDTEAEADGQKDGVNMNKNIFRKFMNRLMNQSRIP